MEAQSEIRELQVMSNWAWMRNRLKVTMTPPGGNPCAVPATRSEYCGRIPIVPGLSLATRIFSPRRLERELQYTNCVEATSFSTFALNRF